MYNGTILEALYMNQKYSKETIQIIVNKYATGQAVALLCTEHNVPRSTIYFWLRQHQKLSSSIGADIWSRHFVSRLSQPEKTGRQHWHIEHLINLNPRSFTAIQTATNGSAVKVTKAAAIFSDCVVGEWLSLTLKRLIFCAV